MHVLVQSISIFMCMFMGLASRIDKGMVASSSPVGGSGTLHINFILCVLTRENWRSDSMTVLGFVVALWLDVYCSAVVVYELL